MWTWPVPLGRACRVCRAMSRPVRTGIAAMAGCGVGRGTCRSCSDISWGPIPKGWRDAIRTGRVGAERRKTSEYRLVGRLVIRLHRVVLILGLQPILEADAGCPMALLIAIENVIQNAGLGPFEVNIFHPKHLFRV